MKKEKKDLKLGISENKDFNQAMLENISCDFYDLFKDIFFGNEKNTRCYEEGESVNCDIKSKPTLPRVAEGPEPGILVL